MKGLGMMKCTWDDTQQIDFGKSTKSVHLRVFEDPQKTDKPIYVCQYNRQDAWTNNEKAVATQALAEHLEHGNLNDVRVWEISAAGVTRELSFETRSYSTRPDRGDMPDAQFEADERARLIQREPQITVDIHDKAISPQQQRQEIGQALLSAEQRQKLGPSHDL